MAKLTMEEKAEIIRASLEASDAGNEEEELRLLRMLPLAPHLAMAGKEVYGAEYMKSAGYDLSAANEEFGDGWLEK
jgi:hypothetical protein